jgi:hypothetical protein
MRVETKTITIGTASLERGNQVAAKVSAMVTVQKISSAWRLMYDVYVFMPCSFLNVFVCVVITLLRVFLNARPHRQYALTLADRPGKRSQRKV